MAVVPTITDREWRAIARVLPPTGGVGRPRRNDREALAVLFRLEALERTRWVVRPCLQGLVDRKTAGLLSVKRQRWREDGTWPKLLAAGAPAIKRMLERELRRDGKSGIARLMKLYERPRA